jgi:predicted deacetylase
VSGLNCGGAGCRVLVLGAARIARRGGLVRIAVDAADLGRSARRSALLDAVDAALHHGASPSTYSTIIERLAHVA